MIVLAIIRSNYIPGLYSWEAFSNVFAMYQRIQVSIAAPSLSFVRFNARQNFSYTSESTEKLIFFSIEISPLDKYTFFPVYF